MNRPPKLALLFVGAAVVGHVGLVLAVPHVIMGTAIKRASKGGAVINEFQFGPRTTKDSRWVVRPSPDLAYSTCVYDLAGGPLLVTSAPTADKSPEFLVDRRSPVHTTLRRVRSRLALARP